jgi:hypothetical protein
MRYNKCMYINDTNCKYHDITGIKNQEIIYTVQWCPPLSITLQFPGVAVSALIVNDGFGRPDTGGGRPVKGGVAKGEEDGRTPHALQAGHPPKAVLGMARPQGV